MKTLLRDGTVITMGPGSFLPGPMDLLIENERIARIAPGESIEAKNVDEVHECRGKIILPGLVSAHTHLTGMFQRGLWDEDTFESWSRKSNATENLLNASAEDIHTIHSAACIELIRHGVTTVLNMFTPRPASWLESIGSACQALIDTGVRGVLALSVKDRSFDKDGKVVDLASSDSLMRSIQDAANLVVGLNPRVTFMPAPSAPQWCSDQLLISCRELADELGVGVHFHLAETKRQAEQGLQLYGEPMVRHLKRIGFLGPRVSAAHCIWLEDEDLNILRERDVKIVHNPASNMKLGSGMARIKKMLTKGLNVGLGADSVNAGTIYSVFEQMKLAVLLPRSFYGSEEWVVPLEAFEMGSLGGAKACFLDGIIGSIEVEKKADLVILNPSAALQPINDLISQIALCENGASVESVFVDGKPLMLDGNLTTIDEEAVLAKLSALIPRIAAAKAAVLRQESRQPR